jgi:hypothetical protein
MGALEAYATKTQDCFASLIPRRKSREPVGQQWRAAPRMGGSTEIAVNDRGE